MQKSWWSTNHPRPTGNVCHVRIQQSDDTWLFPNMITSSISLYILQTFSSFTTSCLQYSSHLARHRFSIPISCSIDLIHQKFAFHWECLASRWPSLPCSTCILSANEHHSLFNCSGPKNTSHSFPECLICEMSPIIHSKSFLGRKRTMFFTFLL